MIGGSHKPNAELVAQGVANIASGIFGGLPATGAIARTAANVNNGGRTPIAGMTHAIVLLIMLVAFMPLAKFIPLCALAAILVNVAYNMSEWHSFKALLKAPKSDITVLLATFFLTVFLDLVVAIEIGMVFAALLFMKRMSDVTNEGFIKECTPLPFVHNAPVTIICLADTGAFNGREIRMYELREAGAFIDTPLDGAGFAEAMKNRAVMSEADAASYLKFNTAIAIDRSP